MKDDPELKKHVFSLPIELAKPAWELVQAGGTPELVGFLFRTRDNPMQAYAKVVGQYEQMRKYEDPLYSMDMALTAILSPEEDPVVPITMLPSNGKSEGIPIDKVYDLVTAARFTETTAESYNVDPADVNFLREFAPERFNTLFWLRSCGVARRDLAMLTEFPESLYRSVFTAVETARRSNPSVSEIAEIVDMYYLDFEAGLLHPSDASLN
jgi:hypothetical protein